MIVVKFGGTSVGDAAAIERAAAIVRAKLPQKPIVVVSALAGATNQLIAIGEQASRGQLIGALRAVEALRERHLRESDALLDPGLACDEVKSELSAMIDELASLAEALSVLGHLTPRSMDAIAAMGEQMSSVLVVAAFCQRGLDVEHVDARNVMITNEEFTKAAPLVDAIAKAVRGELVPFVRAGKVPVLGGYIGSTESGITTTLGRGGSDYSAALIGAAVGAKAIEIWTDVDGMLTADPRVVDGAQLIEEIRFDEAAELASFGAKVLHPSTIAPAVQRGIPVFIYNSRNPEGRGTRITASGPARAVTAIAGRSGVTIVKIRSSRMLMAIGFLRTLFEIFERHRISVDVVATSEVSVSLTVDDATRLDALVSELRALGDVSVERGRAVIAIVGAALGAQGDAMGRALRALGDTPIHMLSLSATEINLTVIVDEDRLTPAMRALHAAFFGSEAA